MTFNFSLYPSYHTIHVFIHISVVAMFYGRYCCCFCFLLNRSKTRIFIFYLIMWTTPLQCKLKISRIYSLNFIHLTGIKLISLGGDAVFVMLWWKHPCYSADIHVVTHFSSTALRHSYLSIKLSLTLSIGMILLQRHPLWRSTRNILFFYCYGHRIFRSDVLLTFIILTLILKWYINHFRDLNFPKSMLALCFFL
jgi:hypothetical protein